MMSQRYLRILQKNFPDNKYYVLRNNNSNLYLPDDKKIKTKDKNLYKFYKLKNIKFNEIKYVKPYISIISDFEDNRIKKIKEVIKCGSHIFCEKPLNDELLSKSDLLVLNNKMKNKKINFAISYFINENALLKQLAKNLSNPNKIIKIEINNSEHIFDIVGYGRGNNSQYFSKKKTRSVFIQQSHDLNFFYRIFGLPKLTYLKLSNKKNTINTDFVSTFIGYYKKYNFDIIINNSFLSANPERVYKIYMKEKVIIVDLHKNFIEIFDYKTRKINKKFYKINRLNIFEKKIKKFINKIKNKKYSNDFIKSAEFSNYIINCLRLKYK